MFATAFTPTALATVTPLNPSRLDACFDPHTLSGSSSGLDAGSLDAAGRLASAAQQQRQQLSSLAASAALPLEQPSNTQQQQQQQLAHVGGYREWRVAGMLQANCALVPVLDAGACQLYLAVVATADVAAGDELMLDYGPEYWEAKLGEWNEREMTTHMLQVRRQDCRSSVLV
jgi:hypothetical protein